MRQRPIGRKSYGLIAIWDRHFPLHGHRRLDQLAQKHPDIWEKLRDRHHAILQSAMEVHKGYVFQIIGDAFCVAFYTANDALLAALDAPRGVQHEEWGETPIKVRMGLHTGSAEYIGNDYRGYLTMAKVQRVMSVASGGQVLLSNCLCFFLLA